MAWFQAWGRQPKLLRNSRFFFVPNAKVYEPCRPSRLNDTVAYQSARKTCPCLRFLYIEQLKARQQPVFTEDGKRILPRKLTRKELQTRKDSETESLKKNKANRYRQEKELLGSQYLDKREHDI